jgi:hypothetical protein
LCGQTIQTHRLAHEKKENVTALDGKGMLGRSRSRWEDNIKMYVTEI